MTPEQSQFLEAQRFFLQQTCRYFGVPPEMIGADSGNPKTYANLEQRNLDFLTFGVGRLELQAELAGRVQVYQDRLVVPARGASFQALPAVPKRLEGLDPTLAILDEFGVIPRDVYEVVSLASGKRDTSLILGIGTPPADWSDSVLGRHARLGR